MRLNLRSHLLVVAISLLTGCLIVFPASAAPFSFSTGNPDGLIGTASRPDALGAFEIESADDFLLTQPTSISSVSFTGLLVGGNISNLALAQTVLEIYRVFPADSNVARTSGPPTFSTPQVPTRVNSPSDVEFVGAAIGDFSSVTATQVSPTFTVANSVTPGGIHPFPNQTTLGNGPQTGQEVQFTVNLSNPFVLPPDHYFFVPQVATNQGFFLWLSAPRPIVPPGTPFMPDLQSWTRDANLDPDWLRVGTDIVGGTTPPTFNAVFSLTGVTVPEPTTLALLGLALGGLAFARRRLQ